MNPKLKAALIGIILLSAAVIVFVKVREYRHRVVSHGGQTREQEAERHAKALSMPKAAIRFDQPEHDFGRITEGEIARHTFHFTNPSEHPLLISKATPTCGCTVPSFPKAPVPPGGSGDITIEFNSSGRAGMQKKSVMIWSNADLERVPLIFRAEVIEQ